MCRRLWPRGNSCDPRTPGAPPSAEHRQGLTPSPPATCRPLLSVSATPSCVLGDPQAASSWEPDLRPNSLQTEPPCLPHECPPASPAACTLHMLSPAQPPVAPVPSPKPPGHCLLCSCRPRVCSLSGTQAAFAPTLPGSGLIVLGKHLSSQWPLPGAGSRAAGSLQEGRPSGAGQAKPFSVPSGLWPCWGRGWQGWQAVAGPA